ncbi:MAG TPA: hypothetical protein VHD55_03230 [Candidatus Paceibacterota bacterium]|nr:hypothetical protein [Candidatus Paceibacterota bacterium]
MKDKIINIFKDKNTIGIVSVLLVASVIANVYFLAQPAVAPTATPPVTSNATTSTAVIESPYGYRNEIVTVYDGKQAKTYSTTTPITEADVKEMRENVIRHQKAMDEYFRKQDELFRSFWYSF